MPADNGRLLTQAAAIREALAQAMARDERVIVVGEGVPDPKGVFGTTSGLREEFGGGAGFRQPSFGKRDDRYLYRRGDCRIAAGDGSPAHRFCFAGHGPDRQ